MVEICGQKRAVLRPRAFGGSLKEQRLTGIFSHCVHMKITTATKTIKVSLYKIIFHLMNFVDMNLFMF